MPKKTVRYPDISDILRRKEQGRREIAARAFGEKIAMLEALRERLAPFHAARRRNDALSANSGQDTKP